MMESRLGVARLVSGRRIAMSDPQPELWQSADLPQRILRATTRRSRPSHASASDVGDGRSRGVTRAFDSVGRCGSLMRACLARAIGDGQRLGWHPVGLGHRSSARKHAAGQFKGAGP